MLSLPRFGSVTLTEHPRRRTAVPASWAGGEYFEQPAADSTDEALSHLPTRFATVQAQQLHPHAGSGQSQHAPHARVLNTGHQEEGRRSLGGSLGPVGRRAQLASILRPLAGGGGGGTVAAGPVGRSTVKADTLVVYVYSSTDPEYEANFRFFLQYGIEDDDGCDYVFVIQQV